MTVVSMCNTDCRLHLRGAADAISITTRFPDVRGMLKGLDRRPSESVSTGCLLAQASTMLC